MQAYRRVDITRPHAGQERHAIHALVADDDAACRSFLRRTLIDLGAKVTCVRSGVAAWCALQADPSIRLAILNWMLPDLDGYEICRRLAGEPARGVRTLLMVGAGFRDHAEILLAPEADGYLDKPFTLAQLHRCLRETPLCRPHS